MSLCFGPVEAGCFNYLTQTPIIIGVHTQLEGVAEKTGEQFNAFTLRHSPGIQGVTSTGGITDRVEKVSVGNSRCVSLPSRIHEDIHAFLAGRGHTAHHHGQHGSEVQGHTGGLGKGDGPIKNHSRIGTSQRCI